MPTGFAAHEHLARCPVAQRLMRPFLIVKPQPAADPGTRLWHRSIRLGEDVFVFAAAPQPLDEDVVQEPPLTVHADPDARGLEFVKEPRARELNPLIGIHNSGILPTTRAPK